MEGWRNKLIPQAQMKELLESVSENRMKICRECPEFSENKKKAGHTTLRVDEHCTDCGCILSAKTRCLTCSCPLKKWVAVISDKTKEDAEN